MDDIRFAHQHFFCLFAYFAQERLAEQLFVLEPLDARIEVEGCHSWTEPEAPLRE